MTRTDTHRPSAINPDEYVFVSFHDHRPEAALVTLAEQETFRAHMARTGAKFSGHDHGGACHICGNANALSVARFWHEPTNTYIEVGETCADKLSDGDALNFASFRKRAKAGVEAAAGKAKAEKFLTDAGMSVAYDIWLQKDVDNWGYEESTISDMVHKLVRYGSLSDKQLSFMGKLIARIDERAEIEAQRAAEAAAAAPIPAEGRMDVQGTILTIKAQESYYGTTLKMLVQHADGWKLWGTVPAALEEAEKGDTVSFTATVSVSDDDPKFGFFKRPSKARNVNKEND